MQFQQCNCGAPAVCGRDQTITSSLLALPKPALSNWENWCLDSDWINRWHTGNVVVFPTSRKYVKPLRVDPTWLKPQQKTAPIWLCASLVQESTVLQLLHLLLTKQETTVSLSVTVFTLCSTSTNLTTCTLTVISKCFNLWHILSKISQF